MGIYRGPAVKLARRFGVNISETEKVQACMDKRPYPPGEHGQRRGRGRRPSDYAIRLKEKQKLRAIYGIGEAQFSNLFVEASRSRGVTGTRFLQLLESRMDNVIFRMGMAHTRRQARQLVVHGHFLVNDKPNDRPAYRLQPGDKITVAPRSRELLVLRENLESSRRGKTPAWLDFDREQMSGRFVRLPERDEIALPINEQLIIEYYSR